MEPDEMVIEAEMAEAELGRLGLSDVRVHHRAGVAWLTAPAGDVAAIACDPLRGEVVRAVRAAGFAGVGVDLDAH